MNKEEKLEFKKLVEDFLPILKANNNKDFIKQSLFCSSNEDASEIVKILTHPEKEKFDAPIKYLLNKKDIYSKYLESSIKKAVVDLYHKLLSDEDKVDDLVYGLIEELIKSENSRYYVISEIENMRVLDAGEYRLIDSTIKKLKKEKLPLDQESCKFLEEDISKLSDKPCIDTTVEAVDTSKAEEKALFNFTVSFNLLRLYSPNIKPLLKGHLLPGVQKLIVYNMTENILSDHVSTVGELRLNNAEINENFYNKLADIGIKELQEDTPITKVVKECLYWFGLGLDEKHTSARLVNFVTVLEGSLKKKEDERQELKKTVSERGAFILYDNYDQRKKAIGQLNKIYNLRSDVVHKAALIDKKIDGEDPASLAGSYSRLILIKLIKMSKELKGNFKAFIDYIDDIKLGKFNEKCAGEKKT